MTTTQTIVNGARTWLDDVAIGLTASAGLFARRRTIVLTEEANGEFAVRQANKGNSADLGRLRFSDGTITAAADVKSMLRDSDVEVMLASDRFLIKPLELPSRASEFMDGIVRSQIDRLTPWSADSAAFGWSAPVGAEGGRIVVTVAATANAAIASLTQELTSLGVRSLTVSTVWPEAPKATPPIVIRQENRFAANVVRVRRVLAVILAAAGLVAATAFAAASFIGDGLQARQDELARRIVERRAVMLKTRQASDDPATTAERELVRRKNASPSSVIVLEILSQVLPDHTYVSELRLESDKLRINGITRDAPSLIRLIEQSRHFARATFYAPTTRAPSDPGDRFHIEVQLAPVFSARP